MKKHQILVAFCLVSIIPAGSVTGQVSFFDASIEAGTKVDSFTNTNGHSLGVNWIDYDNDQLPDLFAVNGYGESPHLYHNNGDGTFDKVDELLPKLPNVVLTHSIFADYDNDGDSDIYICTDNPNWNGMLGQNVPDGPANLLLKNLWVENGGRIIGGEPLFVEVAAAARIQNLVFPAPFPSISTFSNISLPGYRSFTGGWLDYDRDGFVDIYIGNLAPTLDSGNNAANRDFLYRNLGNGTFEDVTLGTGLDPGDGSTNRPTLAFIAAHMDNDLWPDLYAVNVAYEAPGHFDLFYKNTGLGGFVEYTGQSPGLGETSYAGMGVDVADINLDGNWDIYISDLIQGTGLAARNTLNMGIGGGLFHPNSAMEAGVAASNSWGVNFFDADHDGYEDLFVAELNNEPGLLFLNNGDGTFDDVSDEAGIVFPTVAARGSAIADYDRDGDLDIAFITEAGIVLYRNDTANLGNWLQLKLHGTTSNRDAIGALVRVWLNVPGSGPRTLMRQIKGGSSGHGQDDLVMHFGVGDAEIIDRLEILWPSGESKLMLSVPVNQLLEVTEK